MTDDNSPRNPHRQNRPDRARARQQQEREMRQSRQEGNAREHVQGDRIQQQRQESPRTQTRPQTERGSTERGQGERNNVARTGRVNTSNNANNANSTRQSGRGLTGGRSDRGEAPQFWERRMLENVLLEGVTEQRRKRRWGIFFRILFFVYFTVIILLLMQSSSSPQNASGGEVVDGKKGHIAVISISGLIAASEITNAEQIVKSIEKAGQSENNHGIFLDANSPGGSPVQSSQIYQALVAYRSAYPERKIYASVGDVCASGCYYIIAAADEIYADLSSIVGSIGVISQSLGVAEVMDKLGLESRTFIAGEHKDFMNPTRPMREDEKAFMQSILATLHQNFIEAVRAGRGARLKENNQLFSGLFWAGKDALALGLIDGIDTPTGVRKRFGDYAFVDYNFQPPLEKFLRDLRLETAGVISESFDKVQQQNMQKRFQFQ